MEHSRCSKYQTVKLSLRAASIIEMQLRIDFFNYIRLSVFVCHTLIFTAASGILNDDYDIQQ